MTLPDSPARPPHDSGFRLTGTHVLAITLCAFALIIAVNLFMAVQAVRSFPGLEVKNSYIASQTFDIERANQIRLGWTIDARVAQEVLRLEITDAQGAVVVPRALNVSIGRATTQAADFSPQLQIDGGVYLAHIGPLLPGNWDLRVTAIAPDGTPFHQKIPLDIQR
ncbi:FixH [Aquimixticola soesokkakensis]|uniref:FixH n=1 Tax=Aquimixticola soesokkakensis TaxID=1519096 RepID=A0A1Y5ST33_9RHOB|nr:FixH family protein [Aquimixticola soesokkakensis]SLN47886.1 FixH [Aquimixticola soesokkakensis]